MGNFAWILNLVAGLAMFLYGMKIMGEGLEKSAGNQMSQIIDKLTGNIFKGLLIGTLVTALIQSSSATTVMVVGFINAGLMTLQQAVGVIFGANIGTTVTAALISMEDINASTIWILNLLKPSFLAPIAVAAGVILLFFANKKKYHYIGEILAGFGILFLGMEGMSDAMSFLEDSPTFKTIMQQLSNPLLGILAGLVLTMIIQSSSASVGILQAASATGLIAFPTAVAIVLGENIGTCITAVLASVGANRESKKAAWVNVLFNVFGMLIFTIVLFGLGVGALMPVWEHAATKTNIAIFHIVFNILNSFLLLPFSGLLVKIVDKLVPAKKADNTLTTLDERLLQTPTLALVQAKRELMNMMHATKESVDIGFDMLNNQKRTDEDILDALEDKIDIYESNITQYLIKVSDEPMTPAENIAISAMFHVITDIERIGDHAYNISYSLNKLHDGGHSFSTAAKDELVNMYKAVNRMIEKTINAFEEGDAKLAADIQAIEDVVDLLKVQLKDAHLDRLTRHECAFEQGVVFLDLVTNLERIADHCSNVAISVEQISAHGTVIDPHEHLKDIHENPSEEFQRIYDKYVDKYTK